jgi:pimeloyl-ACP methyl ester carboxylesterase
LVIDDVQWADADTLALLRQIAGDAELSQLFIISTYREADVGRSHPLSETIGSLRRMRPLDQISLGGLTEIDVATIIKNWTGYGAQPALARLIHEQTEGNPYFVEEVLRDLAERQLLYSQGEISPVEFAIPDSIKGIINQRVARLSDRVNSVLTIAAVTGRSFGVDALERASGLSRDEVLDALDEAVLARIVVEDPSTAGRYRFAHALMYETLYDELTSTRRVHLHGQTLQYADSNGVKLAYEVLGASGPFVIAMGVSNCPAVRPRSRLTSQRWEILTRYCRVILYDRRGVGFSAAPERGYSVLASMEDVRAVLDAVGAERAILWGATDGGPLAVAFAAHYPERVAGLLLLGTTAKYTSSGDYEWGMNQAALETFVRTDPIDRGEAITQLTRTRAGSEEPGTGPGAISEVMRRVPRHVWSKIVAGIGAADVRSLLEKVAVPTMIVHDPDNAYISVEAARYLHEHIPGSRLVISEEWGKPLLGDELHWAIQSFIDNVTRGRGPR